MNHYVYEITNLINGKKYIGKRSCKCLIEEDKYMGSGTLLKKAIEKYGVNNFKKEILQECYSEEEAYAWEDFYTMQVNAWDNPLYYNLRRGGNGGSSQMSNHTRKIISKKSKKMWEDDNYRSNMTNIIKERSTSKPFREKRSIYSKKQWDNYEYRKLMVNTVKKMWENPKHKEKMRNIMREKWTDPEFKEKMNKRNTTGVNNYNASKVVLLNNLRVFDCIADANIYIGYKKNSSSISNCCRGESKSAGTFNDKPAVWMYYNDYLKLTNEEVNKKIENSLQNNTGKRECLKIVLLNTGTVFNSAKECSEFVGMKSISKIYDVCNNIRKSAGKINGEPAKWMYYEDYLKTIK